MKKFKLAVVAMIIAAGSFATFAFTNGDKEEKKMQQTYWVTGKSDNNYVVSSNPGDAGDCGVGDEPCEIFTSETPDLNNELTPEQIFGNPNTSIESHQNL